MENQILEYIKCDNCSHEFYALFFEGTENLECPNCGEMSTFDIIDGSEDINSNLN